MICLMCAEVVGAQIELRPRGEEDVSVLQDAAEGDSVRIGETPRSCGQVSPLSSDRKIFPSPKPNALLSRCESMYGPSGARRYQKCSVDPLSEDTAHTFLEAGNSRPPTDAEPVARKRRREGKEPPAGLAWFLIPLILAAIKAGSGIRIRIFSTRRITRQKSSRPLANHAHAVFRPRPVGDRDRAKISAPADTLPVGLQSIEFRPHCLPLTGSPTFARKPPCSQKTSRQVRSSSTTETLL